MSTTQYKRYILLTGGSSGIGYEAAKALAADPDTLVVVASRTAPADLPANVEFKALDLADQASVRAFAAWWPYPPMDALIACAGVFSNSGISYVDGVERTFATNHIGHALLFFLLNVRGAIATTARIIFVGSSLHDSESRGRFKPYWTTADEVAHARDPNGAGNPNATYPNSKLANTLFTYALAQRAKAAGRTWTINVFDPGFVPGGGSKLHRDSGVAVGMLMNYVLPNVAWLLSYLGAVVSTAPASGQALARLAADPQFADTTGKMIRINDEMQCSKQAADQALQDDLWDWTVEYLKLAPEQTRV